MKIIREAVAGTLESSDVMIRITPIKEEKILIQLNSSVNKQFGETIKQSVLKTLQALQVNHVQLIIDDKGALDCIIKARLQTVLLRASDTDLIPWDDLS